MILLHIFDVKDMMEQLLLRESFDFFLTEEVWVTTFAKLHIAGRRNIAWYDTDEKNGQMPELLYWKEIKKYIYAYIKGKKTPASFGISLKLPADAARRVSGDPALQALVQQKQLALLLHFRFDGKNLSVVTGCSYLAFTLDKSGELLWDAAAKEYLKGLRITYEEQ
ncbi:MAG: DUF5721 family protein [Clostridiaceae bacterium]|nr:DUF5721 family protein [Clostridiaceae bacterium]